LRLETPELQKQLDLYSQEGLRTLAVGRRQLSKAEGAQAVATLAEVGCAWVMSWRARLGIICFAQTRLFWTPGQR
jgi:hypothetical protein